MCIQDDHTSQHRYRCRPMCATTSAHALNRLRTSVPMSADVSSHGLTFPVPKTCPPLCPPRVPLALVRQWWSIVAIVCPPPLGPSRVPPSLVRQWLSIANGGDTSQPMFTDVYTHRYRCPTQTYTHRHRCRPHCACIATDTTTLMYASVPMLTVVHSHRHRRPPHTHTLISVPITTEVV